MEVQLIDYLDSRPIYEQIADHYKRLILVGAMSENDPMPSVRSLAVELSTNPNTVQKAYALLEREGYIYTGRGKGNFVRGGDTLVENHKKEILEKLVDVLREAKEFSLNLKELVDEAIGRIEK